MRPIFVVKYIYVQSVKKSVKNLALGVNEGVNNTPRGPSSPLGAKITPGGKLHPEGQTQVVRIGLCPLCQ
jgi:hypothetical protein